MPGWYMLSRDVYLYAMLYLEDLCCLEMFTYMPWLQGRQFWAPTDDGSIEELMIAKPVKEPDSAMEGNRGWI